MLGRLLCRAESATDSDLFTLTRKPLCPSHGNTTINVGGFLQSVDACWRGCRDSRRVLQYWRVVFLSAKLSPTPCEDMTRTPVDAKAETIRELQAEEKQREKPDRETISSGRSSSSVGGACVVLWGLRQFKPARCGEHTIDLWGRAAAPL